MPGSLRLAVYFIYMDRFPAFSSADTNNIDYERIAASRATFKSGLAKRVHRWFRLTPSFGPDLVQDLLRETNWVPGRTVLDPFSGAGTTLIEAQLEGVPAIGFEINPLLRFVCETSCNWDVDPDKVSLELNRIVEVFSRQTPGLTLEKLEDLGLEIPPIHNPTRWWRPDVLTGLVLLRSLIDAIEDTDTRDFLRLALAGVLVPELTNVTLGRLQLHFINRDDDHISVLDSYLRHTHVMLEDIKQLRSLELQTRSQVVWDDATTAGNLNHSDKVGIVITSPPYPNRYSYVWNTRPHLYLLGFMTTPKEAGQLDMRSIGGTWGTATSALMRGEVPPVAPSVEKVVKSVVREIREADNLMANYVMKYFNLMAQHLENLNPLLAAKADLAYVVGCSRIKGVFVETDVLLGRLIEEMGFGFEVRRIQRMRKRNSGKDLHESVVFASRP